MADIKLSTVVGSSVGASLIMPQTTNTKAQINIKTSLGAASNANTSNFYSIVETAHSAFGYEIVTLSQAANNTEQTILDITDSGVLTNILSPTINSNGAIMTVRVTIDGSVTTFTDVLVTVGSSALLIGGFINLATDNNNGTSYGGLGDAGYGAPKHIMLNPVQIVEKGGIGMVFKNSLKVTIQGSASLNVGSSTNKAVVGYTTSIPHGLV